VVFDLITPTIGYNKSTRSFLKVAYFYVAAVRIRTPCGIVKRSGENNWVNQHAPHTHTHARTHLCMRCGVGFTATATTLTRSFMHFSSRWPLVIDSDKRTCDYATCTLTRHNNVRQYPFWRSQETSCTLSNKMPSKRKEQRASEICAVFSLTKHIDCIQKH